MNWHDFIFSNQYKFRIRRHSVCWILWWVFIIMTVFFTTTPEAPQGNRLPVFSHYQPGRDELGFISYSLLVLVKSFLLVLTHVFYCNAIIYILLPAFQLKKNYWILIAGTVLTSILVIPMGYFLYTMVYPAIDRLFGLNSLKPDRFIVFRSIDASLVNAVKVTIVAVAIALLKQWWLKQKEKERLEKEKILAEVQLLKAQIHPAFLFSTLNNIISHAEKKSPRAPEMLIKLADLLSYMLYECEVPKVNLEKEIGMISEYMELEKIRQGDRLEMTFRVKGTTEDQLITPLLLLPFIDNSLSYSNNELVEQAWVNLDITIDNNKLSMKLINGRPAGITSDIESEEKSLANVRKRLQLLYPGKHEVKISADQELLMVYLHLNLEQQTGNNTSILEINKSPLSYAGI